MKAIKKSLVVVLSIYMLGTSAQISERRLEKMKIFYQDLPVLVTGGAGFIGSYIVELLVEAGAKVTVIDDLSSGKASNLKNVKGKIRFIKKSITDIGACIEATEGQAVIFHLAAFISVPDSVKNPRTCQKINVDGTFNLLEAARINKVDRFVFSSSAAVYGPFEGICKENMECNPQSPYGTSKRIGELLCKQYSDNYGLKTVILRYFNVFGDRQNPNGAYAGVVAKFRDLMSKNLSLTIFGDGTQTRDFIPVEYVAEANAALAMLENEKMTGQIYNIATGKSINLLDLIDMLKKEFPIYKKKPSFKPARAGDIKHSAADCSKYHNITI